MAVGVVLLERARDGLDITDRAFGSVPVTVYQRAGTDGPVVVISHGFSGSRRMMEAFSLSLARAGYTAVAFDFPGHGDNRTPMSAEIVDLSGATRQLMATLETVIDESRRLTQDDRAIAVLGHSMATDIIVRQALRDDRIGAVIAVSMYSEAVTANAPEELLVVSGQFEPGLRQVALEVLRQVDPQASEDDIVTSPDGAVRRGALVAPSVEHVGVLYSPTSLRAAVDWLDRAYDRTSASEVAGTGGAIGLVLVGAIFLFWPLSRLVRKAPAPGRMRAAVWPILVIPPVATPLLLYPIPIDFLPILGMSYLTAHVGLYGVLTLALLWRAGVRPERFRLWPQAVFIVYALGVFGLLIDRYFSNFVPISDRLVPIALIGLGTVPFMLGDCLMLKARNVPVWVRFASRLAFFASVAAAIALDPGAHLILAFCLPVILLFFLVFGSMARWLEQRVREPTGIGIAQGVLLAYSLGVLFPVAAFVTIA